MSTSARTTSIAAAFAHDRDADYAVRLIASVFETPIAFQRQAVLGERGEVQLVVLTATVADVALVARLEVAMRGAHGVIVTPQALDPEVARAG